MGKLHFYHIIILCRLIPINDSVENFSSYDLEVDLIFYDYVESQEVSLILNIHTKSESYRDATA